MASGGGSTSSVDWIDLDEPHYCTLERLTTSKPGCLNACLVGGSTIFFIVPYIYILGIILPTDSYFSEGWLNHQPDVPKSGKSMVRTGKKHSQLKT